MGREGEGDVTAPANFEEYFMWMYSLFFSLLIFFFRSTMFCFQTSLPEGFLSSARIGQSNLKEVKTFRWDQRGKSLVYFLSFFFSSLDTVDVMEAFKFRAQFAFRWT